MPEFPVDGPITVAFKIASGSVDVVAEERATAHVEVSPGDRRGESQRLADETTVELQGDTLAASVEFNQAIGNRNLVIRSLAPAVYQSAELLKTTAAAVNEVAERLRPQGMRVGYHNHTTDFNRIDGEYWWNRFADQTAKDVMLQFDTGKASEMEGVTPQALIRRNVGRTISIHVKPFSKKDPNAYLGADDLDWPAIMTAAETVGGIEWYIIEYEKEGVPPLQSLKANLALFKKLRS